MISVVEGRPVERVESGIYTGLLPAELVETTPEIHFNGRPMPLVKWAQLVSFFLWSYETYRGESQARLHYRESDGEWMIVVLPQIRSRGLSTKEDQDHPDRDLELHRALGMGFLPIGTAHHHCSAGAFQSGTDENNEHGQPGLHITLGHLDREDALELHARVVYRKVQYPAVLAEWLGDVTGLTSLCWDTPFPEEWKARIVEPPPPPPVEVSSYGSWPWLRERGSVTFSGDGDNGTSWVSDTVAAWRQEQERRKQLSAQMRKAAKDKSKAEEEQTVWTVFRDALASDPASIYDERGAKALVKILDDTPAIPPWGAPITAEERFVQGVDRMIKVCEALQGVCDTAGVPVDVVATCLSRMDKHCLVVPSFRELKDTLLQGISALEKSGLVVVEEAEGSGV